MWRGLQITRKSRLHCKAIIWTVCLPWSTIACRSSSLVDVSDTTGRGRTARSWNQLSDSQGRISGLESVTWSTAGSKNQPRTCRTRWANQEPASHTSGTGRVYEGPGNKIARHSLVWRQDRQSILLSRIVRLFYSLFHCLISDRIWNSEYIYSLLDGVASVWSYLLCNQLRLCPIGNQFRLCPVGSPFRLSPVETVVGCMTSASI